MMYYDKHGDVIEVIGGIGNPPVWFTGRGLKRVKSKFLPPRKTQFEAQCDLDKFAKSHGLEKVEDEE